MSAGNWYTINVGMKEAEVKGKKKEEEKQGKEAEFNGSK